MSGENGWLVPANIDEALEFWKRAEKVVTSEYCDHRGNARRDALRRKNEYLEFVAAQLRGAS